MQFKNRISRVDGFDPETLTVTALSPTHLRVQALAPGVTTLVVTDQNDKIYTVEIFVSGDVRHPQAYIDRFFPKASVQAVAIRDSAVLRGWVTKPAHITELVEIAEQFYPKVLNQMNVGGVQQVLLKVRVIEAQRTKIRRFGMNWAFRNDNSFVASTPGMLTPLAGIATPFGVAPTIGFDATSFSDPTITFGIVGADEAFNGFIEALKQESLLKILAEPELVIMNGRPATLLAGGEFPIIVPAGLGTATIEWREFGTRLEAVAIVLDNDTVRLELQAEVSDRDFANAVSLQGTVVPGLTTRRANTQAEMRFGQTLMIAGLISTRETAVLDKVPFFGELPYIGAAFRRTRIDKSETEVVILVTPELVATLDRHQVPPGGPGLSSESPTDREFMLYGWPEVPSYGGGCYGCGTSSGAAGSLTMPPGGSLRPYPESMQIAPERNLPPAPSIPAPELPTDSTTRSTIRPGLVVPKADTPAVGLRESVRSNRAGMRRRGKNRTGGLVRARGRRLVQASFARWDTMTGTCNDWEVPSDRPAAYCSRDRRRTVREAGLGDRHDRG
jgi:pilus assembly protein CpaC